MLLFLKQFCLEPKQWPLPQLVSGLSSKQAHHYTQTIVFPLANQTWIIREAKFANSRPQPHRIKNSMSQSQIFFFAFLPHMIFLFWESAWWLQLEAIWQAFLRIKFRFRIAIYLFNCLEQFMNHQSCVYLWEKKKQPAILDPIYYGNVNQLFKIFYLKSWLTSEG